MPLMQEVLDHQYKGVHEIKWMCAISVLDLNLFWYEKKKIKIIYGPVREVWTASIEFSFW